MEAKRGKVITFYSYKGGTGRSMALANVACLIARRPEVKRGVLAVDWDLEAPGLHCFFRDSEPKSGVIDLFEELLDLVSQAGQSGTVTEDQAELAVRGLEFSEFIGKTNVPKVDLMCAGRFDGHYAERVNAFEWRTFFEHAPSLMRILAEGLADRYDYVLIDSRTGINDTSNVCTSLLPDQIVLVFTPNAQSISGTIDIARRAAAYRRNSDDIRPLAILPLPSRIDLAEPDLLEEWRFGNPEADASVAGYQGGFEELFRDVYDLPSCDLENYFDEVQIQHVPLYAYGEKIAALLERGSRLSLSRSYSAFADILAKGDPPWSIGPSIEPGAALASEAQVVFDEKWIRTQRSKATIGLKDVGLTGLMEISFGLNKNRAESEGLARRPTTLAEQIKLDQFDLLRAAEAAQIHAFGWPIGVVLQSNDESRPRPSNDGIYAEVASKEGLFSPTYDYWCLRQNGDFYQMSSLFEDSREMGTGARLHFDTRIVRITEALLYCQRLYSELGVARHSFVSFRVRHAGLKSRALTSGNPMRHFRPKRTNEDEVEAGLIVRVGEIEHRLVVLVQQLLKPLFAVFDFTSFREEIYTQIVNGFLTDVRRGG